MVKLDTDSIDGTIEVESAVDLGRECGPERRCRDLLDREVIYDARAVEHPTQWCSGGCALDRRCDLGVVGKIDAFVIDLHAAFGEFADLSACVFGRWSATTDQGQVTGTTSHQPS